MNNSLLNPGGTSVKAALTIAMVCRGKLFNITRSTQISSRAVVPMGCNNQSIQEQLESSANRACFIAAHRLDKDEERFDSALREN